MTVGLPGTGIGGIFYILLAVFMPIRESLRTLKGRTNFRRWCFIVIQLFFVTGVVAAMWGELWLLNKLLILTWGTLKVNGPLLMTGNAFHDTKLIALASAYMSFVSLTFVIAGMHVLRFFVHRTHRKRHATAPKRHTTFQILESPTLTPNVS